MTLKVKRFDNHKIGKNVVVTPQGFLYIPAYTARTGIQKYINKDGKIINEYRPESEVFASGSMDSLRTAVVTDGHPPELINPDNVSRYSVGYTDGVIVKEYNSDDKEHFVKTGLIITHRDAIEAIKAGKAEISLGYNVDLEFTEGQRNGVKYDAIQRNISNNHVAIVWHGRAGKKARLKLDENEAILFDENILENDNKPKGEKMKIVIHGKEFDVADEIGKALEAERSDEKKKTGKLDSDLKSEKERADKLDSEKKALEKDKTSLEAKADSLDSENKKLKETKTDSANVSELVKERIAVLETGKKMLDGETVKKIDSMSNEEIKKAVIKADSPNVDEKKLEKAEYVNARFDHISENLNVSDSQKEEIAKKIAKKDEGKKDDAEYKTPEQIRLDNQKKVIEDAKKPVGRSLEKK